MFIQQEDYTTFQEVCHFCFGKIKPYFLPDKIHRRIAKPAKFY